MGKTNTSSFYLSLSQKDFKKRIKKLYQILENCILCPRECKVNRLKGEKGYCQAPCWLVVSNAFAHFGEEDVLVGWKGSGTIFFSYCNLRCVYCQNYEISCLGKGEKITVQDCSQIMLNLQKIGCHNINLVTPTHFLPFILESVYLASKNGLKIPLVYNCSGYENVKILKFLEGIIDIYMPDFKYGDNSSAKKYSNTPDYFEVAKKAIKEMHRQVGDLKLNNEGLAQKGLLLRHLVLPNDLAGSKKVLEFIAKEISPNTYINIMDQYRPEGKAFEYPEISRPITFQEYQKVILEAKKLGLWRGF